MTSSTETLATAVKNICNGYDPAFMIVRSYSRVEKTGKLDAYNDYRTRQPHHEERRPLIGVSRWADNESRPRACPAHRGVSRMLRSFIQWRESCLCRWMSSSKGLSRWRLGPKRWAWKMNRWKCLTAHVQQRISDGAEFFATPVGSSFEFDGSNLTFASPIVTETASNNRTHCRVFEVHRPGAALLIVPHWNGAQKLRCTGPGLICAWNHDRLPDPSLSRPARILRWTHC